MTYEPPQITHYEPCGHGLPPGVHTCSLEPDHDSEQHQCWCGLRWEWSDDAPMTEHMT